MTSHRISHLAAALAGVLTMSGIATQVLAQEIRVLLALDVRRDVTEENVLLTPVFDVFVGERAAF